jgi:hypothetical protein
VDRGWGCRRGPGGRRRRPGATRMEGDPGDGDVRVTVHGQGRPPAKGWPAQLWMRADRCRKGAGPAADDDRHGPGEGLAVRRRQACLICGKELACAGGSGAASARDDSTYPFTGRPPWPRRQSVLELEEGRPGHGRSLSWNWRKAALVTEPACPGAGGWALWPRRQPVLEMEEGRAGYGGRLSWS